LLAVLQSSIHCASEFCTFCVDFKSQLLHCHWCNTFRHHKTSFHPHSNQVQCSVGIAFRTAHCTVSGNTSHRVPCCHVTVQCFRADRWAMFRLSRWQLQADTPGTERELLSDRRSLWCGECAVGVGGVCRFGGYKTL